MVPKISMEPFHQSFVSLDALHIKNKWVLLRTVYRKVLWGIKYGSLMTSLQKTSFGTFMFKCVLAIIMFKGWSDAPDAEVILLTSWKILKEIETCYITVMSTATHFKYEDSFKVWIFPFHFFYLWLNF